MSWNEVGTMTLFEMSAAGAVLVGVTVLVRALILHRLPKGTLLLLWWLALARFLLPFSLPSPVSAYTLLGEASAVVSQTETAVFTGVPAPLPEALPAVAEEPTPVHAPVPVLPLVWAAGAVGCALFFAVTAARCGKAFRSALPVERREVRDWLAAHPLRRRVQVRSSDRISAPLTYGLLRPVILLPENFAFQDGRLTGYVLTHEWVHIRRLDSLTKRLIIAAACLHWWNPMVWVLYVLFNRDLELSCDETVVRLHGAGTRADYARALIRMEEYKNGPAPFCSSFNRNAMEERILAIMKMKKWTARAAAASAATVFAVGVLFATSAQAAVRGADNGPAEEYPVSAVNWDEERKLLEGFQKHGISYDSGGKMYYNGERVRWFWDGYEIWEDGQLLGWSMRYEYLDKDGTVDVRTLHDRIDNGDGSYDLYGPLSDIVPYSQAEFNSRTYDELKARAQATTAYADDSAVLVEEPAYPGTAVSVDGVIDSVAYGEATGVFTTDEGGYLVQADDELSVSEGTYSERAYVIASPDTDLSQGRTFEEIFAEYRPYGITYHEKDGDRNVYYNGELTAQFVDLQPDGGVFSFASTGGKFSTLVVQTVYDKQGKLTGVEPAGQAASYAPYTRFGLIAGDGGTLYYNGERVRCFDDSTPKPDGGTQAVGYLDPDGTVDVRAVRNRKKELTGLERASDAEFRAREVRMPIGKDTGKNSWAVFDQYAALGLETRDGALYYNGERVRCFLDKSGRKTISNWDAKGSIDVYAVRDGGLTGLRIASEEEFAANSAAHSADGTVKEYAS